MADGLQMLHTLWQKTTKGDRDSEKERERERESKKERKTMRDQNEKYQANRDS